MSPRSVVLLLPVWGESYIEQFFERGLLTLLAPGNLPAVAAVHPCTFRFLTHRDNFESFTRHQLFTELQKYCSVEYIDISDIIFPGNYSTTITMAYLQGMEASGDSYCEDWFFYLVADYLYADGSFANLLPTLASDTRGITNANFQVIEEAVWPLVNEQIKPGATHLSLAPRDLVRLGLAHVHPIVIASTVNQDMSHNSHANRLFWRIDRETMIGRFFLRHMLAIRPERRVESVGASCDYSFIPEFCPSGQVMHITDSDMFMLIELQPLNHELSYVEYGPWKNGVLVAKLNQWTTKEHRENASQAVIYHASDITDRTAAIVSESLDWINWLRAKLHDTPQPSRGHHYWLGAINAAQQYIANRNATSDAHLFNLDQEFSTDNRLMQRLRTLHFLLFGRMPKVYPWHPRWLECRYGMRALAPHLANPAQRILMITRAPLPFADWLQRHYGERVHSVHIDHFVTPKYQTSRLGTIPYDVLLIHTDLTYLPRLSEIVRKAQPHMKPGADIILFAENEYYTIRNDHVLQQNLLGSSHFLFSGDVHISAREEFGGHLHRLVRLAQQKIYERVDPTRIRFSTLYALALIPLYALFFVLNMLYLVHPPRRMRPLSSLFIQFRTPL